MVQRAHICLGKFSPSFDSDQDTCERNGTDDTALTAVTSKEDMYDDKEEGEETRAVLPSSHSWRAPTPIHRLSLSPFVRFYPHRTERASACVRAYMYEGARVLARASCLRALCGGCACAHIRVRSRVHVCACACSRVEQVYALLVSFFFLSLSILAVLPVSLRGSVFLLVEKATREGAL